MEKIQAGLGLAALLAVAWASGERRGLPSWRLIGLGLVLQFALAFLLLESAAARAVLAALNDAVLALDRATSAGTSLVFGFLGGGPLPFEEPYPGASFVLAFRALPLVLVTAALSAVLWHWGILGRVIGGLAWALKRLFGLDGAAAFGTAANVFVGMVEAGVLLKPKLGGMSRADLLLVMTAGLATIAGTVWVLYATILGPVVDGAVGHLTVASIISVPASVVIARLMIPAEGSTPIIPSGESGDGPGYAGTMDALVSGIGDGLRLLMNIIATLIVFVALVALVNEILGAIPAIAGAPLSVERILGWCLAPVAWLLGIPWAEAGTAGVLLGIKVVLNELVAYLRMSGLPEGALSERSTIILTYAMCGFANVGSVGIMLAGFLALAPDRRADLIPLASRALLGGVLATFMTAAVVAILI